MPEHFVAKIGKKNVDCYPFEHLYAKANNLNWQPRKTIGAAMSKHFSKDACYNYSKDGGVDFVIWHLSDNKTETFDGRYFLNDEPEVVYCLINNYNIVDTTDNCMLLKKSNGKANLQISDTTKTFSAKFFQWIDIPKAECDIIRMKAKSKNTLYGKIKAFLIRDVIYFIDYKMENGEILTYRYYNSVAEEGLWVSPFVYSMIDGKKEKVVKVRLRNSEEKCVNSDVQLQFEYINFMKK